MSQNLISIFLSIFCPVAAYGRLVTVASSMFLVLGSL